MVSNFFGLSLNLFIYLFILLFLTAFKSQEAENVK